MYSRYRYAKAYGSLWRGGKESSSFCWGLLWGYSLFIFYVASITGGREGNLRVWEEGTKGTKGLVEWYLHQRKGGCETLLGVDLNSHCSDRGVFVYGHFFGCCRKRRTFAMCEVAAMDAATCPCVFRRSARAFKTPVSLLTY